MNRLGAALGAAMVAAGLSLTFAGAAQGVDARVTCQTVIELNQSLGLLSAFTCSGPSNVTSGKLIILSTHDTYRCASLKPSPLGIQFGVGGGGCFRQPGS